MYCTVQKYIYPFVNKVYAGSFCVSVIRQTLTWTTESLTCVRDHSYVCIYTQGLGTLTASQHIIFYSEKLRNVSCALDGDGTWVTDVIES